MKEAYFVVILVLYTAETVGMIGKRELKLMKNTATLINVIRGGIVDETTFYNALKSGTIWAVGLDVFETEPIPLDNLLLTFPNVTVLPHIGSVSKKMRLAMMNINAQAIMDVLEGWKLENKTVCKKSINVLRSNESRTDS